MAAAKSQRRGRYRRPRHHGRLVRAQSARAGWRVVGFDISAARARSWPRPASRSPATPRRSPRPCPIIITSLPKPEALIATAKEIAAAEAAAPHHRRVLDLHDRGQGEGREGAARRRARHARLPGERHRLAGPDRRPRDLCQRRPQGDRQDQAGVRRLLAQDLRRRRVRQRQPDEVRRQSAGRDQQRRFGGSHGARHEGRPRSEARSSK